MLIIFKLSPTHPPFFMLPDLTPAALHARLAAGEDIQLIDVREEMEFAHQKARLCSWAFCYESTC